MSQIRRWLILSLLCCPTTGCALLDHFDRPARQDWTEGRQQHRALMREQTESAPVSASMRVAEGDRHQRRGDLQAAVLSYVEAARLSPDSTESFQRLALIQLRFNPERAELSFRSLLEKAPEDPRAWLGLGLAHLSQGELQEARAALEEALKWNADSVDARTALGVVYDRLGEYERGRAELRAALEKEPTHFQAINNLGVSHLERGELVEAEEMFRRALALAPRDEVASNHLALTVGLQGRYEEALEIFRRVGDEQRAQNNLGYLYRLSGKADLAAGAYERALLVGGHETLQVLRNLDAIKPER